MKKMLSIILALVMMVSCTVPVSAETTDAAAQGGFSFSLSGLMTGDAAINSFKDAINNYNPMNMPAHDTSDIDVLLASGELDKCNMLGISVDFLYNNTNEFQWGSLFELDRDGNIIFFDENGVQVPASVGGQPRLAVTQGDIALANANLNMYLRRILNRLYSGSQFYTSENATNLTNIIGRMFYPNYVDQVVTFTGTQSVTEDNFYKTIVEKSGLGALIQTNWCDVVPSVNFNAFLTIFGINLDDILKSEYKDGYALGQKLLKAAVSKLLSDGPIDFVLDFIWAFSRAYTSSLYEPTKALFSLKINAGYIDYEEMKTLTGLLNLLANDNNSDDTSKLQFIEAPARRFGMAKDINELFLYLLVYLNLNCRYKENNAVIEQYNFNIHSLPIENDDKVKISNIITALLSGRIDNVVDVLGELYTTNVEEVGDDIWTSFRVYLERFFLKIAEFFDNWYKILTGQKDFGT